MTAAITPSRLGRNVEAVASVPSSNTGRNFARKGKVSSTKTPLHPDPLTSAREAVGCLVDWLNFTVKFDGTDPAFDRFFDTEAAERFVRGIFDGGGARFGLTEIEQRGFNGYTHSALIISAGGEKVGRYAVGGNNDTVHVCLEGSGCGLVEDWTHVAVMLERIGARITRCDLAFDDYLGEHIPLLEWRELAMNGEIHAGTGARPKRWRFIDADEASGRSLYVGLKGQKELCVYEKGKEQGDPESPWMRAEVRLWAKCVDIPCDVLRQPLAYLRAAYNVLSSLPGDVCTRLRSVQRAVDANMRRAVAWLTEATGPLFHVIKRAIGPEAMAGFLAHHIARVGVPSRFRRFSPQDLNTLVREAIPNAGRCYPLGAVLA